MNIFREIDLNEKINVNAVMYADKVKITKNFFLKKLS